MEAESGSTLKDGWCLFPSDAFISEFHVGIITANSQPRQVMFGSRLTPFIIASFAETEIQASLTNVYAAAVMLQLETI